MAEDSLEILWRGSDPAKFTALQAALRDEGIPFWQMQAHDHAGGFLSSRPYYLEAVAGFEIRVHAPDLDRARSALAWVESKESNSDMESERLHRTDSHPTLHPDLPIDWDPNEATSEIWSGEEESTAEYLASALRENGIPSLIPDEPGHRARLCVRPADQTRAKDIVHEVIDGKIPE